MPESVGILQVLLCELSSQLTSLVRPLSDAPQYDAAKVMYDLKEASSSVSEANGLTRRLSSSSATGSQSALDPRVSRTRRTGPELVCALEDVGRSEGFHRSQARTTSQPWFRRTSPRRPASSPTSSKPLDRARPSRSLLGGPFDVPRRQRLAEARSGLEEYLDVASVTEASGESTAAGSGTVPRRLRRRARGSGCGSTRGRKLFACGRQSSPGRSFLGPFQRAYQCGTAARSTIGTCLASSTLPSGRTPSRQCWLSLRASLSVSANVGFQILRRRFKLATAPLVVASPADPKIRRDVCGAAGRPSRMATKREPVAPVSQRHDWI